jgi:large subunit ribosomal protein L2
MFVGSVINNLELIPGRGAQCLRAAGVSAYIYLKRDNYVVIKMPSGILKKISSACVSSYGVVSFSLFKYLRKGTAGRNRLYNIRPTVRGVVMNPVDHPHGGGEGKKSQPRLPLTP